MLSEELGKVGRFVKAQPLGDQVDRSICMGQQPFCLQSDTSGATVLGIQSCQALCRPIEALLRATKGVGVRANLVPSGGVGKPWGDRLRWWFHC